MSSVLAATVLLASSARGAATSDSDAFRQLPVSAAEAAFGQATIAVVHDATAFHWNPGGLGMLTGIDAGASYSKLYQGLGSYHMFAAATPVAGSALSIGAAWVRLGVDDIPYYPSLDGFQTPGERQVHARTGASGHFAFSQNGYYLTVARRNEITLDLGWQYLTLQMTAPVGVTVKYLTISAGDSASASGIGIDVGSQFRFDLGRAMDSQYLGAAAFGIVLANAGGTRMTWDTPTKHEDEEEMALPYGVSYEQPLPIAKGSLLMAVAGHGEGMSWGLEYNMLETLYLRTGRNAVTSRLDLGAGLAWQGVHVDYALQRHPLGSTHRVSLRYHR